MSRFLRPVAASAVVAALAFVTGCSSISVQPGRDRSAALPPPQRIIVGGFGYADANVRADREGARLTQFKHDLAARMRADLTKSLGRFGVPVVEAPRVDAVPAGPRGWLVTGEFTRVDQGSRALRVVVGAGAGGTKMQTRVRVTDTATGRLVCAFRTTGGSNADSGIITSYGPLTAATLGGAIINVAGSSAHGVTEDARRTAKMIADYISQQLVKCRAIAPNRAREPKILAGDVDPLGSLRN